MSNILRDIKQNHWTMKYRSQCLTFILRLNTVSYHFIIWKYDIHMSNGLSDIGQTSLDHEILVTVTYNHIEVKGCVIHFIIWKYDVHMSNDLQDIKQNHWTMKYRSQGWLAFILRWIIVSHHFIIWKYDVNMSNGLSDIEQNHWTMKYRSQWPIFILRSNTVS